MGYQDSDSINKIWVSIAWPGKWNWKTERERRAVDVLGTPMANEGQQCDLMASKEWARKKALEDKSVSKGKQNSRNFWKPASASPSPWVSHSISLSDSPSLMPGEPFKLYSVLPQSSECMSHMPHSHDITGPGTARGTSHSQALLLCIAHCTRGCGARRERVNFLSQAKAKFQSSPQSTS